MRSESGFVEAAHAFEEEGGGVLEEVPLDVDVVVGFEAELAFGPGEEFVEHFFAVDRCVDPVDLSLDEDHVEGLLAADDEASGAVGCITGQFPLLGAGAWKKTEWNT